MESNKNMKANGTDPLLSRRGFLMLAGVAGTTILGGAALAGCASGTSTDQSSSSDAAGAQGTGTHEVIDMACNKLTLPVSPTKYADGWFAHNEVTIMLAGAEGLVATDCMPKSYPWMYKVNPNMAKATATFGDNFNFEDLVALGPQLIFSSSEDLRSKCNEVGIPLVNCLFTSFDEMKQSVKLSGDVFGGKAPQIAENYVNELEKVLSDIKAKTDALSDDERPSILHGDSVYELTVDGTETIIDDWIKVAGGKNAVTASTKANAHAKFSMEQIITWNPDIIITGKPEEVDKILNDQNWSSITAVRNKKVFVNPRGVFGWDRYGVEELLQVQWAAALINPDLFKDLDINTKVKDFYSTYLNYQLTDDEVKLILAAKDPS